MPTKERLNELLKYDSDTGYLYWKQQRSNIKKGARAGCRGLFGGQYYWNLRIDGKLQLAHRVIWSLCFGPIQAGMHIDHIDHDGLNNSLANLRLVDTRENNRNVSLQMRKKNGLPLGVRATPEGKWQARIHIGKKTIHLGTFTDISSAAAARKLADVKYGFHPNHGQAQPSL